MDSKSSRHILPAAQSAAFTGRYRLIALTPAAKLRRTGVFYNDGGLSNRRCYLMKPDTVLVHLARDVALAGGDFDRAAQLITEAAATALGVGRAAVWMFSANRSALECTDLFEKEDGRHRSGEVVHITHPPLYVTTLEEEKVVAISDAADDTRAAEFADHYIEDNNVASLLDAPIRVAGKVVGMLRLEHLGEQHAWTPDEIAFAGAAADQTAQSRLQADRERTERALRENEALLAEAQSIANLGNFTHDMRKGSVLWSKQLYAIYGLDPSEPPPIGDRRAAMMVDDDYRKTTEAFNHHAKTGTPYEMVYRVKRPDGAVRTLHSICHWTKDRNGKVVSYSGTIQDITERERAAEERRALETQIQHMQKLESLGVLAGGIAHDFNNLLVAMLGNAELAMEDVPSTNPAFQNLKEIERAAHRAAELCRQMLAYSGRGKLTTSLLHINDVVTEMSDLLGVSVTKKTSLRYDLGQDLPPVMADLTQMHQVIMNLVVNASEAVGEQSGSITVRTGSLECEKEYLRKTYMDRDLLEGLYVSLEVSDTGCGMDTATRERIFDPFFTTKFTGRGLGLAAVLGIVRAHQGGIKVYSEPMQGTTFKILIPAASGQDGRPAEPAASSREWKGHGTVLLVDDEETVREVAERMLTRMGFTVLTAADGREALDTFREHADDIACVVLDLTMPEMDGEEAFRELRRMQPDIRVMVSSGYNEQDVTTRFLGKGLTGFIQKPYRTTALRAKLQEILEEKA